MPQPNLQELYRSMARIRVFEEGLLARFRSGEARGTTHTSIGQEATACAVMSCLRDEDYVFSNHRCHGHYLAHGGSMRALLWEIMGLPEGVCGGIGGSQHLCEGRFFSNGIQGGIVPVTCGLALAQKMRGDAGIAVCFLGDGTLGEGSVYESFNLASILCLPVLFVIEANGIAQTTRTTHTLAGEMAARPAAFGIPVSEDSSRDALQLCSSMEAAVKHVREKRTPFCQIVHLPRLGPHSKGDDTRDEQEIRSLREHDPMIKLRSALNGGVADQIDREIAAEIDVLFTEAVQASKARSQTTGTAVLTDEELIVPTPAGDPITQGGANGVEQLRAALGHILAVHPEVVVIGEDLLDPYGGAFKATWGLQAAYPDRFISSPISEAGIVGVGNGLALAGMRPIIEIMFGDFITLIADQIINHAAKFHGMYNRQVYCPVIIRAPMGGYRGYGPTHSQSLEKIFLGVPGLVITAASPYHDMQHLWNAMLAQKHPILHIENKTAYGRSVPVREGNRIGIYQVEASSATFPSIRLSLAGQVRRPQVVILTYGGGATLAADAVRAAFEEDEIIANVVIVSQLSPLPALELEWAVGDAAAFVTLEEGPVRGGWGAEVTATLLADRPRKAARIGAAQSVIPSSESGELAALPSLAGVLETLRRLVS